MVSHYGYITSVLAFGCSETSLSTYNSRNVEYGSVNEIMMGTMVSQSF